MPSDVAVQEVAVAGDGGRQGEVAGSGNSGGGRSY